MFAIVNFGSKQYKAVIGEAFEAERINFEIGTKFEINDISLVSDKNEVILEKSELSKYKVVGKVIKEYRDDKVIVFKKKRRKGYTRKRGHRQYVSVFFVEDIVKVS
jgi:large subunit ribosomal protein L21